MDALKAILKKYLSQRTRQGACKFLYSLAYYAEYFLWGGKFKERVLLGLLRQYYASKFRREWIFSGQPPHFFDQRMTYFSFGYGKRVVGPYSLFRGFFVADILRDGDKLLDIGCGDGFFARRFHAARSAHIDAIDIDPKALRSATSDNSAPNIVYCLLDAANQPFPSDTYDVVVWDGAIGHFSKTDCIQVLEKICKVLSPEGVFVGSESLGKEGSDHLEFFSSLDDLHLLFKPYFKHVELRCVSYRIGVKGETTRQEAYWRCSNSPKRLQECHWQEYLPAEGLSSDN